MAHGTTVRLGTLRCPSEPVQTFRSPRPRAAATGRSARLDGRVHRARSTSFSCRVGRGHTHRPLRATSSAPAAGMEQLSASKMPAQHHTRAGTPWRCYARRVGLHVHPRNHARRTPDVPPGSGLQADVAAAATVDWLHRAGAADRQAPITGRPAFLPPRHCVVDVRRRRASAGRRAAYRRG